MTSPPTNAVTSLEWLTPCFCRWWYIFIRNSCIPAQRAVHITHQGHSKTLHFDYAVHFCISFTVHSKCRLFPSTVFTDTFIQGAYKLPEEFAKSHFHKYWTERHDVTTIRKRNICSFIVTLNAFDVRPTWDTADVQAILPFPPNPSKHVLCDVPDCGVDALSQFW